MAIGAQQQLVAAQGGLTPWQAAQQRTLATQAAAPPVAAPSLMSGGMWSGWGPQGQSQWDTSSGTPVWKGTGTNPNVSWLSPTVNNQIDYYNPGLMAQLQKVNWNSGTPGAGSEAGIDPNAIFSQMIKSGATGDQLVKFANMASDASNGGWMGQFGREAHGDTLQNNIDTFLQNPNATHADYTSNPGEGGGWLGQHAGTVFNALTNPLDAATGGRLSAATGQLGANIYDKTAGQLGGFGGKIFGQTGALAPITRSLNALSVGLATPGSMAPVESALQANYQVDRNQLGMAPRQSMGQTGSAAAQIAATAATMGGASPFLAAGIGAAGGAAGAYGQGQGLSGMLRSAAINAGAQAIGGGIGHYVPGLIGGGAFGNIAGQSLGGAASGAARGAFTHGDIGRDALLGGLGGLGGSAFGSLGGEFGGRIGSAIGGQLGRLGAQYLGSQWGAPSRQQQRSSGLQLNSSGMPTGGALPQPGLTTKAYPSITGNNMGTDQQTLLAQTQQPDPQMSMQQSAAQQYQQLLNQFNQQSSRGYA